MDNWESFIKKTLDLIGFADYHLEIKMDERRGSVFIYEDQEMVKENLPAIVDAVNHILQMVAKKNQTEAIFLDVNNYRHDRERLIAELARAAAKKAADNQDGGRASRDEFIRAPPRAHGARGASRSEDRKRRRRERAIRHHQANITNNH